MTHIYLYINYVWSENTKHISCVRDRMVEHMLFFNHAEITIKEELFSCRCTPRVTICPPASDFVAAVEAPAGSTSAAAKTGALGAAILRPLTSPVFMSCTLPLQNTRSRKVCYHGDLTWLCWLLLSGHTKLYCRGFAWLGLLSGAQPSNHTGDQLQPHRMHILSGHYV